MLLSRARVHIYDVISCQNFFCSVAQKAIITEQQRRKLHATLLRRKGKTKLNQFQAFLFSSLSPISISLFSLSLCRFSFIVQRHKINTPSLTFSVHFYWAISRVKRNPNRRYNTVLAINSCLSVSPLHCSGLEQENRHNIVCIVHDNWPSSHRRFPWHVSSISLSLSHLRACNVSNTASLR